MSYIGYKSYYYVCDDLGTPIPVGAVTWEAWFETANRVVGYDKVHGNKISTVFLGIDHNFDGGIPILWETMIFGGEHDGYCRRYSSKSDALEGHALAVLIAKGETTPEAVAEMLGNLEEGN